MAIKTITNLKSDADSFINDNATRDISPADIRDRVKDLADSSINRVDDKLLLNLRTYVTTRAYEIGEHTELSLTIYKCTTATSGAFNPAHWTAVIGPESLSLGQLSDVTITAPALNQVLQYNGSQWVNATFAGAGITSLNGLSGSSQTFATGTTGTDFNISSATTVHTFNLPTASGTNRGALSSADWTTFNNKFTLPALTSGSILFSDGSTIAQDNANLFWDDTNNRLSIGTNTSNNTLTVNGNVAIGTTISATARLHLRGTGATSATYSFRFENSAATNLFEQTNEGHIGHGTAATTSYWYDLKGTYAGPNLLRMGDTLDDTVINLTRQGSMTVGHANNGEVIVYRKANNVLTHGAFFTMNHQNSANAETTYGQMWTRVVDNTAASEDGRINFSVKTAGTLQVAMTLEGVHYQLPLLQVGSAGLASGDLYKDTAANILAAGDYVVAMKA